MSEPRDRLDDWLRAEVEPLAPPPGTFERVSHKAHRRKVRQALMSAAAAAIVVAVAATIPGIVLHGNTGRPGQQAAAGTPRPTARPAATGPTGGTAPRPSSPVPTGQAPASLLNPGPLPGNFQPTSVTFVGEHTGAVIGQAGIQGHCATRYCTSLAGTSDYGRTWFGVSAPRTGAPDGARGVGQLRFLDNYNGWAFGPQLWVTHDSGATWQQEQTDGMRVTDLETAGDRAFALFARCSGGGADFGAHCTGFSLYTSLSDSDQWQPVPGPAADLAQAGAGQPASASLVLAGGRGYLLAPSGELLTGPLTGAAWTVAAAQAPCFPGAPGPGGQPTGALLAAAGQGQLILVCTSATSAAGDSQTKMVMQSSDGGGSWSTAGQGPSAGIATSVAAQANVLVLATDAGLDLSTDGGVSWQLAQPGPAQATSGELGFSYVGMTSDSNGVALPADPGLHEVFITTDGGSTWQPQAVGSP